jgi:hypothetical protein
MPSATIEATNTSCGSLVAKSVNNTTVFFGEYLINVINDLLVDSGVIVTSENSTVFIGENPISIQGDITTPHKGVPHPKVSKTSVVLESVSTVMIG